MPTIPRSIAFRAPLLATLALLGLAGCAPSTPPGAPATVPAPVPATTTATTPADVTAGWTPYSDAVDHFSLRYPPAWQHRSCPSGGHIGLFLAPTTAGVGVCNSGFVGQMSIVAVTGDERAAYQITGEPGVVSAPVTVGGVAGTRQSVTLSGAGLGPPAGTREVVYLFFTGGRTYRCAYDQTPTGATATDVLADFDLLVTHTLAFS